MKKINNPTNNPMIAWYNGETVSYNDKKNGVHYIPALWDENRKRCSYSNGKTGIISVSFLAGNACHEYNGSIPDVLKENPIFEGITGTCNCDCPGCYAKAMTRYPDTFVKLALNTIEMKENPVKFFALVEKELFANPLTAPRVFRLHDSGDISSPEYYSAMTDFIGRHPETVFGTYTKRDDIVKDEHGNVNKPNNLTMSCSPWITSDGVVLCAPINDLPQFIYDDGTNPELANLPHCPAVDKNGKKTGKTCINCLHCYTAKPGQRWAVYAHK